MNKLSPVEYWLVEFLVVGSIVYEVLQVRLVQFAMLKVSFPKLREVFGIYREAIAG